MSQSWGSAWLLLILVASCGLPAAAGAASSTWPNWRGPDFDAAVPHSDVFEGLERIGLQMVWRQALGSGYSSVSVADGRAVTMFSDGEFDYAVGLDAGTGEERWRFRIAETYVGHDGSHTGPISTPLIAGDKVFGLGPRGHLFALEAATGRKIWSTGLVEDHQASKPDYGFSTSPILLDGVLVVQFGVQEKASIAGFDPATGEILWITGSDTINYQSPIALTIDGRRQLLAVGDTHLYGMDPRSGEVLWEHEHGGDQSTIGAQSMNPVLVGDNRILLTHKRDESTLVEVGKQDGAIVAREVWISRSVRNTYNTPVYHQGHIYAYSSRFLTCVDAATGEAVWKSRQPGDGWLMLLDGHLLIVTKKGTLHLAEASPEGYREVASLELFEDLAWTPASFAGERIFARSLGEVAAIDLSKPAAVAKIEPGGDGSPAPSDSPFGSLLAKLETAPDKTVVVDQFLASAESFPVVEGRDLVHFIYRGPGDDLAIAGDMIGFRREEPMTQAPGTDLFYYSIRLEPDARVSYRFIKDFEETLTDPLNPRKAPSIFGEVSWVSMPEWREPLHLQDPDGSLRGRVETVELESRHFDEKRRLDVYLPAGYDEGHRRYPVVYVHWGRAAQDWARMSNTLDVLIGKSVEPLIAVFINQLPPAQGAEFLEDPKDKYAESFVEELIPFIDSRYRTVASPEARATVGMGYAGYTAFYTALKHPGRVGKVSSQTTFLLDSQMDELEPLVRTATEQPLEIYLEWGKYDLRGYNEAWDLGRANRRWAEFLGSRGYELSGGEVHDGFGWGSWRNRTDVVLETLFPAETAGAAAQRTTVE
jgi:enterochelin esterase-like enzyme/outer membrane protein assembly factor BamB